MEKLVQVEISYSDKDVKQAISFIINRLNNMWILLVITAIVEIAILIYGFRKGFDNYLFGLFIVFLICGFIYYIRFYLVPINKYIDFYRKRKGGTYIFSSQEVKFTGVDIQSTGAWSLFKKAFEIPSALILMDENKFIYIFPKNCFKSSEDIEKIRNLITENVIGFRIYK